MGQKIQEEILKLQTEINKLRTEYLSKGNREKNKNDKRSWLLYSILGVVVFVVLCITAALGENHVTHPSVERSQNNNAVVEEYSDEVELAREIDKDAGSETKGAVPKFTEHEQTELKQTESAEAQPERTETTLICKCPGWKSDSWGS